MRRLWLVIGLAVVAAVGGAATVALTSREGAPSSGAATRPRIALPNCLGKPVITPRQVTLSCGDAGFSVDRLRWTGWGESFAAGRGRARVNDCDPSCADGQVHVFPAVLIASERQTCSGGTRAYRKIEYAFIGLSPFPPDAPGTTAPSGIFKCRAP